VPPHALPIGNRSGEKATIRQKNAAV